jgi:hypothetical protein
MPVCFSWPCKAVSEIETVTTLCSCLYFDDLILGFWRRGLSPSNMHAPHAPLLYPIHEKYHPIVLLAFPIHCNARHLVYTVHATVKSRESLTESKSDVRHPPLCNQQRKTVCLQHLYTSRLPIRVLFVAARRATALWLELEVSRDDRPY